MGPISDWLDYNGLYWDWPIFLSNVVGFLVILFVLYKFALPPVKNLMRKQQDSVAEAVRESKAAAQRAEQADTAHDDAIARGKAEAEELRAGAAEDAKAITADIEAAADREVARIQESVSGRVDQHRLGLLRKTRGELGESALTAAGDLVRQYLQNPQAQAESVERVISELESMADGSAASEVPTSADVVGLHSMRAGSREAALATGKDVATAAESASSEELVAVGDELSQVVALLNTNPVLRKKLADQEDTTSLVSALFDGKVSRTTLGVLTTAARGRWNSQADYLQALRRTASVAVLTAADKAGAAGEVEDELFRAERILAGQPELGGLLGDTSRPASSRAGLVDSVFGPKASSYTTALLRNTAVSLDGQSYDLAVDQLVELSAARRGEAVARVVAAGELSAQQEERLEAVLGRVYGRAISVQTEIRPEVLGGLRIVIGDEVIRGDVSSRLAKAQIALPR